MGLSAMLFMHYSFVLLTYAQLQGFYDLPLPRSKSTSPTHSILSPSISISPNPPSSSTHYLFSSSSSPSLSYMGTSPSHFQSVLSSTSSPTFSLFPLFPSSNFTPPNISIFASSSLSHLTAIPSSTSFISPPSLSSNPYSFNPSPKPFQPVFSFSTAPSPFSVDTTLSPTPSVIYKFPSSILSSITPSNLPTYSFVYSSPLPSPTYIDTVVSITPPFLPSSSPTSHNLFSPSLSPRPSFLAFSRSPSLSYVYNSTFPDTSPSPTPHDMFLSPSVAHPLSSLDPSPSSLILPSTTSKILSTPSPSPKLQRNLQSPIQKPSNSLHLHPVDSSGLSLHPVPSSSPHYASPEQQFSTLTPSPRSSLSISMTTEVSNTPTHSLMVIVEIMPIPTPKISESSSQKVALLSPSVTANIDNSLIFEDITGSVGLHNQPSKGEQFGGATIADLNSDGHYDIILTYHNRQPMRIYFGSSDGRFSRSPFFLRSDIHGVTVAKRTAYSDETLMIVSVGGGRGTLLRAPFIYLIKPDKSIISITDQFGFGKGKGRGRITLFMDMSLRAVEERREVLGGPDLLIVNLLGVKNNLCHFAYQNAFGNYSLRDVPSFSKVNEERAIITDADNDGIMELVHFSVLRIFKLVAPFTFRDVTTDLWPGAKERDMKRSVSAVVELDYNNDGYMDLYLARARAPLVTPRGPKSVRDVADVLLKNVGGRYMDVSEESKIPRDTDSMGVSAEDFDNNGYVDVIITTFEGPDLILLNQGDGTFAIIDAETTKVQKTRGANVMAFDYDLDGRVDYIVGQGWRKSYFGNYKLMRNQLKVSSQSHYLIVRVGNEPTLACTSLNAIVTVYLSDDHQLYRRVGGRGAQAGGQSYIDAVHFGLGGYNFIERVAVKWVTGMMEEKLGILVDQIIYFGTTNRIN